VTWAIVGVLWVPLSAYIVFSWLLSDRFTPTPLGLTAPWTSHQFPIYEALPWGGLGWAPLMVLAYFRDDRGLTVVERDVDRMRIANAGKTVLRILAVVAVTNTCYLAYNIAINWVGFSIDNDGSHAYPSYLINGLCDDRIPCPGTENAVIPLGGEPGRPSDIPGDGKTWIDVHFHR